MMNTKAQSTIEFTFAMVIVALLIFGLIKTFRWVGMDWAQSAYRQEQSNIFAHPPGCGNNCFSINAEVNPRSERLNAFTRNF